MAYKSFECIQFFHFSFPILSCVARLKKNLWEIRLNDLCLIKSKACILGLYLVAEVTLEDGTLERPSNDVTFKISNLKFQVSIHKYMSSLSDIFKEGRFTFDHHKSYVMTPRNMANFLKVNKE